MPSSIWYAGGMPPLNASTKVVGTPASAQSALEYPQIAVLCVLTSLESALLVTVAYKHEVRAVASSHESVVDPVVDLRSHKRLLPPLGVSR